MTVRIPRSPVPASVSSGVRDPELAALLRPHLATLADEIVEEIRRCVPEFARPLQGRFAAGIRLGVEQGLRQFADRLAHPGTPCEQGVEVYRALGRGEYLEGRSLDALQAAYRVGARVAWRRFADIGRQGDQPPETMYVLAETVFAFIEEISAHSVDAYAELSTRTVGTLQRRRRRLLELLLADPPVTGISGIGRLARDAQWRVPESVAVIVVDGPWHATHLLSPAIGPDVLMDL